LKTGDLGYVDAEGYLYIVDRKKDMIVTGGENVFPTEVEGYLYRDPNVLEAAVFGIPDSRWVERVVAAVVLKQGSRISAEELINGLRGHMATYKCPKSIFFAPTLPKSAAGKILRKELRSRYGNSAR
jgi:long-chain acyl-CoA synthetase